MEQKKSMMLYTSIWREKQTFKACPTSADSPYLEFIYDTQAKTMFCLLKFVNKALQFVNKVDKFGDFIKLERPLKYRAQDALGAQERIEIERPAEYILEKREDIEAFLERFCENESTFDYKTYLDAPSTAEQTPAKLQMVNEGQTPEDLIKGMVPKGLSVVKEEV